MHGWYRGNAITALSATEECFAADAIVRAGPDQIVKAEVSSGRTGA